MRKPLVDVLLTEDLPDFDGAVHDAKVDAAVKASKQRSAGKTLQGILRFKTLEGIFLNYTLKGIFMDYTAYTPKQLGQTLRGQRKSQQLTQKDAAKMVGLLPKTVSKLELATETATIESLFKLLSALELELVVRTRSANAQDREW